MYNKTYLIIKANEVNLININRNYCFICLIRQYDDYMR